MADINFEDIQPFVEGQGDTGKTAREKINRNFQKLKGFNDAVRDIAKMQNDMDGKVDKTSNQETFIEDNSDCDTYIDGEGNVVVKIGELGEGKKGIQASDFYDKNGNSLTEKLSATEEQVLEVGEQVEGRLPKETSEEQTLSDGSAAEYWVDGRGNIGMFLDRNGILHVRKVETNDSGEEQIEEDNSEDEIWCDRFGNIGMILTGKGTLKVGKIDGEFSSNIENSIALPKYIFCLVGVQRNFWHRSLLARWNPNDYYLQFGGTAPYQRRTPLVATIKDDDLTKLNGKKITLSLIDYRKMKSVQEITNVTVRAALPKSDNDGLNLIKVMFVGSSTTQSCYFREALTRYVSNYKLIGLRHRENDNNIIHEAHGGCTLGSFFDTNLSIDATSHFFPFMQPSGSYRYWGSTGFWKNAILNADTTDNSDTPAPGAYKNGCYIASALAKFDSTTGFLDSPTTFDIMYDTDNSRFVKFNGSVWQEVAKTDYEWTFQFGKYIDMWELDTPDVVVITLGSNDFRNADLPIDFTRWDEMAVEFINGVKGKNQNAKVVLCSQGPFGENGYDGLPVAMLNYKCWLHFKNMIDMFGNLESQGIYVLDQTSELSAEYGFPVIMTGDATKSQTSVVHTFPDYRRPLAYATDLYHELYTHDGKDTAEPYYIEQKMTVLNADSVHPQMSYANMGIPIAAFLQYIRQQ